MPRAAKLLQPTDERKRRRPQGVTEDRRIGGLIKMRRIELGLSQSELGTAIGTSFQQIQKYEKGDNAVASTRMTDLCKALRITPNDIFDWTHGAADFNPGKYNNRVIEIAHLVSGLDREMQASILDLLRTLTKTPPEV